MREGKKLNKGALADSGDLARTPGEIDKYGTWLKQIPEGYYAHMFFRDKIPLAISPREDRNDGYYNINRNANQWMADLVIDTGLWASGASNNFFQTLPKPACATPDLYLDDVMFAGFHCVGADPTTIELIPPGEQRSDSLLSRHHDELRKLTTVLEGPDFSRRSGFRFDDFLESGRIFQVDLSKYAQVRSPSRFAVWPAVLFWSPVPGGKDLLPLAVELRKPDGGTSLVLAARFASSSAAARAAAEPGSPWVRAKRMYLTAAANYHELGTHLARCHLVMERYALATYRKLPPSHPVGMLLRPHFKFMVATNHEAREALINPGGPIDRSFMAKVDDLLQVTDDAFATWDLRIHGGIEADLKRRGVPDGSTLHNYLYRICGLPVYNAIRNFVGAYLDLWYQSDATVRADEALRTWNASLSREYRVSPNSLPLREDNPTLVDLAEALTNIIWTCGPQHSAVNYAQYPYFGDANTLPFGLYAETGAKMFEVPRDSIKDQALVITRLSAFRYDKLGHYKQDDSLTEYGGLGDPNKPWSIVITKFQGALDSLAQANDAAYSAYEFLRPELITNGISI